MVTCFDDSGAKNKGASRLRDQEQQAKFGRTSEPRTKPLGAVISIQRLVLLRRWNRWKERRLVASGDSKGWECIFTGYLTKSCDDVGPGVCCGMLGIDVLGDAPPSEHGESSPNFIPHQHQEREAGDVYHSCGRIV